jgi:hypothetical protein
VKIHEERGSGKCPTQDQGEQYSPGVKHFRAAADEKAWASLPAPV